MRGRSSVVWPAGVEQVGLEDLGRLGINQDDQLFWDGRRIEVRRSLNLTLFQKVVTGIVTFFAVLGGVGGFVTGLNSASIFLCARDVHWLSCPVQAATSQAAASLPSSSAPAHTAAPSPVQPPATRLR
jgi:hypothetical protein